MTKTDHPRHKKTARQRAQEALGIAQRRVDTLTKQHKKAKAETDRLATELDQAKARLDYAQKDPALQTEGKSTTTAAPPSGGTTA